jgi:poly(3-hydroxybutyrate) depolymerase
MSGRSSDPGARPRCAAPNAPRDKIGSPFLRFLPPFGVRWPIFLLAFLFGTANAAGPYYEGSFPDSTPSFTRATLTIGGTPRDVLLYRPAGVVSPPLLVLFTGTGGTLDYSLLDEIGRGEMQSFADREGVVVAAPMPRLMPRGDWDNHFAGSYYWETATLESVDSPVSSDPDSNPDLIFVRAILDESLRVYGADADRVYFSGFSNGAFFSYFAAAVLRSRVAAFAETGGGLVLSHTTYGDPPCSVSAPPGASGAVRSCAASGWTAHSCESSGAIARPIAPTGLDRLPAGFLQANDDDASVPFAHTCNLAEALSGRADVVARVVHNGGGHIWNSGYLQDSWDFMKTKTRPPPIATAPGAPAITTVTAGRARATVAFAAPADNGGSAITGYTATCTAAGRSARSGSGTASPIVVSGLSGGVLYSCTVVARNSAGTGAASVAVAVTPLAVPAILVPILTLLLN